MSHKKAKYTVFATYSFMGVTEEFASSLEGLARDQKVILRTERGIEIGFLISQPEDIGDREIPENTGEVIRILQPKDFELVDHLENEVQPREFKFCLSKIRERNLPMKLIAVEHLFGGNKIIFYFLADGRIDFRELVKDLAKEYRTRIEMKQIGVRDEARILGDYEHCGRELCCRAYMKNLDPVSMKMAKKQKTTLDPSKISGRCGRLMCCLKFEDEVYSELRQGVPKRGSVITTPRASGTVILSDVIKQTVTIDTGNQKQMEVSVNEITSIQPPVRGDDNQYDDENRQTQNFGCCHKCGLQKEGQEQSCKCHTTEQPQQKENSEQPHNQQQQRPPQNKPNRRKNRSPKNHRNQNKQGGRPQND